MPKVTCESCQKRLEECRKNEHGQPQPRDLFEVGNYSTTGMGHQMFHTKTGKTALCVVPRKLNDS